MTTPTLNLLEGSGRSGFVSVRPIAAAATHRQLAQFLDQFAFGSGPNPGPLQASLAQGGELGAAIAGLSTAQRGALERGLGASVVAELISLAEEGDATLFAESLFSLAQRQELAGRMEAAAALYARLATGELSASLAGRAQSQFDALVGRGALGPRAEFLLRRLAHEATEPSTLLAMTGAGALFRLTRLATLSRLAASPTANLFTRGLGARAVSGLAAFAVEAPAFTLAGRLGAEALGRPQDWSRGALGRDIASSYLVLGGLRLAGWASGAAYRGLAGPAAGLRYQPIQALFQQGGMFSGILLGHALEQRLGLRPAMAGATTWIDSLAMLLQFHVAGRLGHHLFGPRVAAWERGLEAQTEVLARENFGRRGPGLLASLGPRLVPAAATSTLPEVGPRSAEEILRGVQILMSKMDDGNGGRREMPGTAVRGEPVPGADPNRLDRDISTFLLSAGDNFELGLRTFIESQPLACAVARLERGNNDFGRIFMSNRKFSEMFGYTEAEAGQHNITFFFNKLSLPFIASRIWGIVRGGLFAPTNMKFRHRDGNWVEIRGSGVIKDIAGQSIAFGFYEPRSSAASGERAQERILDALSASNQTRPLRSNEGVVEVDSVVELSSQLTRERSPLLEQVLTQDVRIRITNMPWVQAPEGYAEPLVRYFNAQARKMEFPMGRRILVEFPATESRARTSISIVKFMEGFRALGIGETEAGSGGTAARSRAGANASPWLSAAMPEAVPAVALSPRVPATIIPEAPAPLSPTAPDARTAEAMVRLQAELGMALQEVKEQAAREDVEITLTGPYESAFLRQNLDSLSSEIQALTQRRIPLPLGRRLTLVFPTERGLLRLAFKKVLLNFERIEE